MIAYDPQYLEIINLQQGIHIPNTHQTTPFESIWSTEGALSPFPHIKGLKSGPCSLLLKWSILPHITLHTAHVNKLATVQRQWHNNMDNAWLLERSVKKPDDIFGKYV